MHLNIRFDKEVEIILRNLLQNQEKLKEINDFDISDLILSKKQMVKIASYEMEIYQRIEPILIYGDILNDVIKSLKKRID